jgi:coenzyme F420-reducing hydrogenase gamma subunit
MDLLMAFPIVPVTAAGPIVSVGDCAVIGFVRYLRDGKNQNIDAISSGSP